MKKLQKTKKKDIAKETILALALYPDRRTQANKLGITEDGLSWRLKEYPEIKETVAKIPEEALMRLQAGSINAVEVFLRNLGNPQKDMEAAREVLDRVGITKKETPSVLQQFQVGGEMTLEFIKDTEKTT